MQSAGSVIVRAYTSDAYLPIRDAAVIFTMQETDGQQALLAIRITDQSGLTAPVLVETPNLNRSVSPGASSPPYTIVTIGVDAPGYDSVTIEGIQIFPGIETIQGVQLLPKALSQYHVSQTNISRQSYQTL